MPSQESQQPVTANSELVYEVSREELPVSCPTPEMTLWNSHPRVYLPLAEQGRAICPYCSAEFVLKD